MRSTKILLALALLALMSTGCRRGKSELPETPPQGLGGQVDRAALEHDSGLVRLGDIYTGSASDDDDVSKWLVRLEGSKCYTFSGVGDENVDELELAIFDDEDDRQENEGGDRQTLMEFCPDEPGTYRLEARVEDGRGHFAVGVFQKGGDGATASAPGAPDGGDLGAQADAEAARVAPEAKRNDAHLDGSGAKTTWPVTLEAGYCYWFVAAGGPGVEEMSLHLYGDGAAPIAEQMGDSPKVVLEYCAGQSGNRRLEGRITSGAGFYKVGKYAYQPPTARR